MEKFKKMKSARERLSWDSLSDEEKEQFEKHERHLASGSERKNKVHPNIEKELKEIRQILYIITTIVSAIWGVLIVILIFKP